MSAPDTNLLCKLVTDISSYVRIYIYNRHGSLDLELHEKITLIFGASYI